MTPTETKFPVVYYSVVLRQPPRVVHTQEEADVLDADPGWTTIPPKQAPEDDAAQWPQVYYDVNVPPIIVGSRADLKTLDLTRYRPFALSEEVVKAAQAKLDAEAGNEA